MARRKAKAFTLIELLVVVSIIILLVTILAPAVGQAVRSVRVGICATHLKDIVRACRQYAMDDLNHRGSVPKSFPLASPQPSSENWWTPEGNRACLWLLVKHKYATPGLFVCPSLEGVEPADVNDGKFADGKFGYSFQSMVDLRLTLDSLPTSRVIVADQSPRFEPFTNTVLPEGLKANSLAHLDADEKPTGQNVGRADESVKFMKTSKVATGNNNNDWIYHCKYPAQDAQGKSINIDDVFLN